MSAAGSTPTKMGDQISSLLDTAIVTARDAEYAAGRGSGAGDVAKKRIGAGYIGVECDRELAHRYHRTPKEKRDSVVSGGELQRHADSGHWTEAKTAEWLRLAGFELHTERADGRQFGYQVARDPETGQARIAGEIDGCLTAGPVDLPYPVLWESKKATVKKWAKFSKSGVAMADVKYYGQLQTNMAYLDVKHTLFSMLNLNTMKYYWELVSFDAAVAQRLTDRAVRIIGSESPDESQRIGYDPTDYRCRFCDFHDACWESKSAAPAAAPLPPPWFLSAMSKVANT